MAACQLLRLRENHAAVDPDTRAECPEALLVLVNRPCADIASARERHTGLTVLAEQCTDQIIRCTDLTYIIIVNLMGKNVLTADGNNMTVIRIRILNLRSDGFDSFQKNMYIVDVRQIADRNLLIRHDRRRKNTQCGILGTADLDCTNERIAAPDQILFHNTPQILSTVNPAQKKRHQASYPHNMKYYPHF